MAYNKTNWVDGETPLNAENLNNIEKGLELCHQSLEHKMDKRGDVIDGNVVLPTETDIFEVTGRYLYGSTVVGSHSLIGIEKDPIIPSRYLIRYTIESGIPQSTYFDTDDCQFELLYSSFIEVIIIESANVNEFLTLQFKSSKMLPATSFKNMSAPTDDFDATNKQYVDNKLSSMMNSFVSLEEESIKLSNTQYTDTYFGIFFKGVNPSSTETLLNIYLNLTSMTKTVNANEYLIYATHPASIPINFIFQISDEQSEAFESIYTKIVAIRFKNVATNGTALELDCLISPKELLIKDVKSPVDATDAANKQYVDEFLSSLPVFRLDATKETVDCNNLIDEGIYFITGTPDNGPVRISGCIIAVMKTDSSITRQTELTMGYKRISAYGTWGGWDNLFQAKVDNNLKTANHDIVAAINELKALIDNIPIYSDGDEVSY